MITAGPGAEDDHYHRRSLTLDREADALLEQLAADTGKPLSQVVCLGLRSLIGDRRMLRHALAQPLNALRMTTHMLATQPGDAELHAQVAGQFTRIGTLLSPPKNLRATSAQRRSAAADQQRVDNRQASDAR